MTRFIISTIGSIIGAFFLIWAFSGCAGTGNAPKLQSHLASAQSNTTKTGNSITSVRGHLDTADYKGSRAIKLLNEGVDQ